jgi:hypothetical protein
MLSEVERLVFNRSRVQLEIHNLRAAAMWAISGTTVDDVPLGARVIIALGFESVPMSDRFVEARTPGSKALAMARDICNPSLLSLALYAQALASSLTDPEVALSAADESLALAKAGTIHTNYCFALSLASAVHTRVGNLRRAIVELKDAIQSQLGTGNRLPLGALDWTVPRSCSRKSGARTRPSS